MNENENNVTELQNNSTMGPTPAPTPQPVETPIPAPVEAPTPVIEPVASTPEPTPVVEQGQTPAPKKNNKLLIIIIVVVLLLGVGAWYVFTQTDLLSTNTKEEAKKSDKKKDKDKKEDEDEDDDKDEDDDDDTPSPGYEELKKYNGVYTLGNNTVKLYPLENETILYLINDESYGFAVYKDDKVIDDTWDETTEFRLHGDELFVKSDENPGVDGTYTRKSAYEAKDIIDDKFGSYELFNNSFNGYYTMKDDDMYTFQIDEDTVRVIILSANTFSSFDLEFDIVDDKTIRTEFFEDVYTITFDGDTAVFTSEGEDHDHNGTYKKESTVGVEELLEIGMI